MSPREAAARSRTRPIAIGEVEVGGRAPIRVEARMRATPWDPAGPAAAIAEARGWIDARGPARPEILSIGVPAGGRADAMDAFDRGLGGAARRIPILLEWDLRIPGEIHAIEPLLPWCAAIGAIVAPAKLPLLARMAARVRKPLRLRIDDPNGAAEAARICSAEGCADLCFRAPAAHAIGTAAAAGIDPACPIFIELPAGPIDAAIAGGRVLLEGIGNGIVLARDPVGTDDPVGTAYTILQACRLRLTRAEFIACPSCGRTQFDLLATTARIQDLTAHLVGVKIAVMGCIVNGPGEMADADFGYVGSAPGKVDLYVGKTRIRQAVPEAEAPERLCDLIRAHGMWVEPGAAEEGRK